MKQDVITAVNKRQCKILYISVQTKTTKISKYDTVETAYSDHICPGNMDHDKQISIPNIFVILLHEYKVTKWTASLFTEFKIQYSCFKHLLFYCCI